MHNRIYHLALDKRTSSALALLGYKSTTKIPLIQKLDGGNYLLWHFKMTIYLRVKAYGNIPQT
jgi:hypothetical protein